MKSEEAVAILASEGRAQVAVSCQHDRRSLLPPTFVLYLFDSFFLAFFVFLAPVATKFNFTQ